MPSRQKKKSSPTPKHHNKPSSKCVEDQRPQPVPIRAKVNNRFYEPLVLLITLNNTWANQRRTRAPSEYHETNSAADHFQNFVNKLSQLCDWKRGGVTVTALAVLQHPSHVEYRFASNQRSVGELEEVKAFIESLLVSLRDVGRHSSSEIASRILCMVLPYLRQRIGLYSKNLMINVDLCIRACKRDGTSEDSVILDELVTIASLLSSLDLNADAESFSRQCGNLFHSLASIERPEMNEIISSRSKEGRIDEKQCWCEFRHAATRLISYYRAAQSLATMARRCPELFDDFEVSFLPSSRPIKCPLKPRSLRDGLKMRDIIGRMTSDPDVLDLHLRCAEHIEPLLNVDAEINEQEWSKELRPVVHAEMLILDSLSKERDTSSTGFFGGYQYIGCSKPTCRLCEYYFASHQSGIKVRQGHPNVYANWRVPDVFAVLDSPTMKNAEAMMNHVLQRLRQDVFRTLRDRMPDTKRHDSNTEPTFPMDEEILEQEQKVDKLAYVLQYTTVEEVQEYHSTSPLTASSVSLNDDVVYASEESESDGENGGVLL